jgi:hypothetical protein
MWPSHLSSAFLKCGQKTSDPRSKMHRISHLRTHFCHALLSSLAHCPFPKETLKFSTSVSKAHISLDFSAAQGNSGIFETLRAFLGPMGRASPPFSFRFLMGSLTSAVRIKSRCHTVSQRPRRNEMHSRGIREMRISNAKAAFLCVNFEGT